MTVLRSDLAMVKHELNLTIWYIIRVFRENVDDSLENWTIWYPCRADSDLSRY